MIINVWILVTPKPTICRAYISTCEIAKRFLERHRERGRNATRDVRFTMCFAFYNLIIIL